MWIPASMIILLFLFMIIIGIVFTLLAKQNGIESPNYKFDWTKEEPSSDSERNV